MLFSDDLEMHALSDRLPIEQTAVQAIEAGCDALLICSDFDLQERAVAALIAKAEADAPFLHRCVEAAQQSLRARRRFPPSPSPALDPALVQSLQALANS